MAQYTMGAGLEAMRRDGASSFYHYNHLGTALALTGADEAVSDTYRHDAWGVLLESTGDTVNPHTYVGRERYYRMPEAEMYHLGFRDYAQGLGRFTTVDPLFETSLPNASALEVLTGKGIPRVLATSLIRTAAPSEGVVLAFSYSGNRVSIMTDAAGLQRIPGLDPEPDPRERLVPNVGRLPRDSQGRICAGAWLRWANCKAIRQYSVLSPCWANYWRCKFEPMKYPGLPIIDENEDIDCSYYLDGEGWRCQTEDQCVCITEAGGTIHPGACGNVTPPHGEYPTPPWLPPFEDLPPYEKEKYPPGYFDPSDDYWLWLR